MLDAHGVRSREIVLIFVATLFVTIRCRDIPPRYEPMLLMPCYANHRRRRLVDVVEFTLMRDEGETPAMP